MQLFNLYVNNVSLILNQAENGKNYDSIKGIAVADPGFLEGGL